jgi:hypothetical protein
MGSAKRHRRFFQGSLIIFAMVMTGFPAVASSAQHVTLKNVEATSIIVGYVGQQKSASWLTIKAGLTSYNPKPESLLQNRAKRFARLDLIRFDYQKSEIVF